MKDKILEILKNTDDYVSGEKISEKFKMTRSGIWKYINKLRDEGYQIESSPRLGYRLVSSPDRLSYAELSPGLKTLYIGREMLYLDSLDSTNRLMKEMAKDRPEGFMLVAEEQTAGRGRKGRGWVSPKGKGLYFSLLLKPRLHPSYASRITLLAAAAIVKGLEELEVEAEVKWPNDILINKKKLAGILTELKGDIDYLDYLVVGMGINVNLDLEDIDQDFRERASSLKLEGFKLERKQVLAAILNNFELLYDQFKKDGDISSSLEIVRASSAFLDRELRIISPAESYKARAIDLAEDGSLIVLRDGRKERVLSGEISIRGLEGYI